MTVTLEDLVEVVDNVSPNKAKFGYTASGATSTYLFQPDDAEDLQDAIALILGDVSNDVGDGRIQRTLPIAHPVYTTLYADSVEIYGHGQYTLTDANPQLEAPTMPQFALYEEYVLVVNFTQRPYAVLPDTSVRMYNSGNQWTNPAGSLTGYKYAAEWVRYTYFTVQDRSEFITAQQGQNVLRADGDQLPEGVPFAGMPKVFMPGQQINIIWEQVPSRYIGSPNSYITSFQGMVNQFSFWNWQAGQLLYLGYEPAFFTPPVQQELVVGDQNPNPAIGTTQRLMRVVLKFLVTFRTAVNPPSVANANFIVNHNNAFPWFAGDTPVLSKSRNFYYVTTVAKAGDDTGASEVPTFFSFPLELLFTDPDA